MTFEELRMKTQIYKMPKKDQRHLYNYIEEIYIEKQKVIDALNDFLMVRKCEDHTHTYIDESKFFKLKKELGL